jgi:hypothetical protein
MFPQRAAGVLLRTDTNTRANRTLATTTIACLPLARDQHRATSCRTTRSEITIAGKWARIVRKVVTVARIASP